MSIKQARELGIIAKPAPTKGGMNSLEERYAGYMKQEGLIYYFEPLKLILVHGIPHQRSEVSYKIDFLVAKAPMTRSVSPAARGARTSCYGSYIIEHGLEVHEVKGFWREDARLKIKMAAELFPCFVFKGVTWNRKERIWEFESF